MRLSIITVSLLLAACGGGSSDGDAPAAPDGGPQVEIPGTPGGTPVPDADTPAPPFTVSDDSVTDGVPGDGGTIDGDGAPGGDAASDDDDADDGGAPDGDATAGGGMPNDDGTSGDDATSGGDEETDAGGVQDDGMQDDDDASDDDGVQDDDGTSDDDAMSGGDDATDDDGSSDDDGASGDTDAPIGDDSSDTDGSTEGEGSSDDTDTASGDGSPDGDDGGMPGDDGDGTSGDDDTSNDGADTDDASAAPSVIDATNYVPLTEFAIRTNVLILTDRAFSPVVFVDRFPPDISALLQEANLNEPGVPATTSGNCSAGGSYSGSASRGGPDGSYTIDYDRCRTESEALDGSTQANLGSVGSQITYELEHSYSDSPDGPGTTIVEGSLDTGDVGSRFFDLTNYSRNTPRRGFSVSGSGGRRNTSNQDGGAFAFAYTSRTDIRIQGEDGPINLEVSVDGLVISDDGALGGTASLEAQDGSRVDVAPGDSPDTVALTRTDSAGNEFTDTVAWDDIYQPPN